MEIITDFNYLYKAFKKSKNRRSYKKSAMYFELDAVSEIEKMQRELKDKTYEVSGYSEFEVRYPKRRKIKACKFRDKVVQHVLCDNVLKSHLPKICIDDNYAGQEGKGTLYAREDLKEKIARYSFEHGMKGYFYKGDIEKYYYNIEHEKAIDIMQYHFPEEVHWLIEKFINSTDGKGIALGNQINTIVSNLYLDGLDKFVTGELGIKYYGRYADDFYLIHESKAYLKYCEDCIQTYLDTLSLRLNTKSQIIQYKNGISFIGFHFYPDGRIEVLNEKRRGYRRKFNRMAKLVRCGKVQMKELLKSYQSWKAHASYSTENRFGYYEYKIKEMEREMLIKDGYYISRRTSKDYPVSRVDVDTLYLPFDIRKTEGGYKFEEYRINLPIEKDIDPEIMKKVIEIVPDTSKVVDKTIKEGLGIASADMTKCKNAMMLAKESAVKEDDKTLGIAFAFMFERWKPGVYEAGDVRKDPDTGGPCECIQDHDSLANTTWTIKERTLWKPWHSRKQEFALPWEKPTGAHDIYKAGEYMIYTDGKLYLCKQDTNFSPEEYAQAWEVVE